MKQLLELSVFLPFSLHIPTLSCIIPVILLLLHVLAEQCQCVVVIWVKVLPIVLVSWLLTSRVKQHW